MGCFFFWLGIMYIKCKRTDENGPKKVSFAYHLFFLCCVCVRSIYVSRSIIVHSSIIRNEIKLWNLLIWAQSTHVSYRSTDNLFYFFFFLFYFIRILHAIQHIQLISMNMKHQHEWKIQWFRYLISAMRKCCAVTTNTNKPRLDIDRFFLKIQLNLYIVQNSINKNH